uniref:5-hydroxytryptamine receptor 3C-like n=1 Tax=Poecilia latipinna TaxID=48699 RepID=A0A3B3VXG3_9TELE
LTLETPSLSSVSSQNGPTHESMQAVFDMQPFRPAVNLSNPTVANISFTLYAVLGVVSKCMQTEGKLFWHNEYLVWEPEECDGVARISLPVKELWSPDIIVYDVDDDVSQACPYVYVNHTGHIRWDRMLRLVSACNLEIFSFPFDVQNCTFTFGSYIVSPALTFSEMSENSKQYLEASGEWELVDILGETSILQFGVDEWDIITFWVVIRRRPVLYVVNLLIPSSFLMLIDILSFYLPPHSVDRASFKMTLILGYTVFLLIMNDLLPRDRTPLINVFFSISLALMVASLLETVFITNIQFSSSQYSAVPHWLSVLVLRYLAVVVCMSPKKSNRVTVCLNPSYKEPALEELKKLTRDLTAIRLQVDKHFQGSKTAEEWQMIGIVIDRLLFYLYIVFIIASFITITGIWIWNNTYAA